MQIPLIMSHQWWWLTAPERIACWKQAKLGQNLSVCVCVFFFGPHSAGFSSVCHLQELESKISSNTVEQENDVYEECERNGDQLNEGGWFRELFYELLRGSLVQLIGWRRNRHLAVAQMPVLKPVKVHQWDFVGSGFGFLINDWPVTGTLVKWQQKLFA